MSCFTKIGKRNTPRSFQDDCWRRGVISLSAILGLKNHPESTRTKVGSGSQCPESVPRSEPNHREAVRTNEFIAKANI